MSGPTPRRARLRRAVLATTFLAANAAACQAILGIGDDNFHVESIVEAGADAAMEAARPATCGHALVPPSKPAIGDGPSGRNIVFAFTRLDLSGKTDAGGSAGYDLDGVCTCDPGDDSARAGTSACVPPAAPIRTGACDYDAGVDNGILEPFQQIANFAALVGATLDDPTQVQCGRQTGLVTLASYNGTGNDPSVAVGLVPSFGIRTEHEGGVGPDASVCYAKGQPPDQPPFPAKFDGEDVWTFRAGDVANGSPTRPFLGWVRDWELIVDGRMGQETVPFVFGNSITIVGTPIITARIVPLDATGAPLAIVGGVPVGQDGKPVTPTRFRLERGVLAGRTSAEAILRAIGTLNTSGDTDPSFCSEGSYQIVRGLICSAADTVADNSRDFKGDPCDALSMVVQFDAVEGKLGEVFEPNFPDAGCGVDFRDDCRDL